ncbi:uncharacterized protein LOC121236096 [Juglans microcarpa x Juglans regia]|uniref:uncharacterized protein LOC121236096 n=1 Tax=Juglans microcarpa x Juglans regia TaxID=2249226 RepID=UPI001B7E8D90|nr:uncharacterized protein LOC121236096 [Juglans microcarpa x Juglans regia]XP_040988526.1 uncharacterized protein LOC121236096 [Juglans microcarpa x Juglans regia]
MKKKPELSDEQELEILKAVAQAWQSHSGSSRPMAEFDAHKQNFKGKPSRFRQEFEAMSSKKSSDNGTKVVTWDFGQSLCDSYEIVTLSKRLETGLVSDNPFTALNDLEGGVHRRHKEKGRNSLRNLFKVMSSRLHSTTSVFPSSFEKREQCFP